MINISEVRGAIFDLDDTLLDNGPVDKPEEWLHTRTRLAAIHEVGKEMGIPELATMPASENATAFTTAKVHSLEGAVWNLLHRFNMVQGEDIDTSHPLYPAVQEIFRRKNVLHYDILRQYGKEVPGSSAFVKALGAAGLSDYLAIGTNATFPDVEFYRDAYGLLEYFPDERVISYEKITKPKPDPECFDLAFRSLHLPDSARRNVLAFEDNPRGILSAKGAGLFVCAITTRYKRDAPALLAAEPDAIADSYEEYAELLGLPTTLS